MTLRRERAPRVAKTPRRRGAIQRGTTMTVNPEYSVKTWSLHRLRDSATAVARRTTRATYVDKGTKFPRNNGPLQRLGRSERSSNSNKKGIRIKTTMGTTKKPKWFSNNNSNRHRLLDRV